MMGGELLMRLNCYWLWCWCWDGAEMVREYGAEVFCDGGGDY